MRAAELWGHAPAIPSEQTRFCGAHRFRPDGEPLPFAETPMAELLTTGRAVCDREVMFERPDGTRLTILENLNPLFDEDGSLIGGVNCFQDITARKAAEARLEQRERWYRDLLEALPAAIYTTDADGRITFFNQAAAHLAGRRPVLGQESWCVTWKLYSPSVERLGGRRSRRNRQGAACAVLLRRRRSAEGRRSASDARADSGDRARRRAA